MKIAIASVVSLCLAFGLVTWWALEWSGVAEIQTHAPNGALRPTHVWFAEPNGELWVEAGTPENSWYLDVQRDPRVSFSSGGRSGRFVAERVEEPGAHDRIRSLLRDKYGARDWWIGVLFDTSHSVAVRLVPAEKATGEPADGGDSGR